jgi:hypothetical protein
MKLIKLQTDNRLQKKLISVKFTNLFGVLCDSKLRNFKASGKKML